MSIKEKWEKVKASNKLAGFKDQVKAEWLKYEKEAFYGLLLILIASLSFGLGRMTKIEEAREPVRIENALASQEDLATDSQLEAETALSVQPEAVNLVATVVASKKGKRYYFPWCGGVKTIKKENIISFPSEDEAQKSGYTLSASCSKMGE